MKAKNVNVLARIFDSAKDYVNLRQELFKLNILKNMTKISTVLVTVFTFILAGTLLLIFAFATFVVWYGSRSNDYTGGLLIVLGIVVFFSIILFVFHKRIFNSLFIKLYAEIIFEDDDED